MHGPLLAGFLLARACVGGVVAVLSGRGFSGLLLLLLLVEPSQLLVVLELARLRARRLAGLAARGRGRVGGSELLRQLLHLQLAAPLHALVVLLLLLVVGGGGHRGSLLMHRRGEEGDRMVVMVGDLRLSVGGRRNAARLTLSHRLGGLREPLKVELVGVPFSVHLLHDILVVVVPKRPTELVVVHVGLALPLAPLARHLVRVEQLELAIATLPADARGVCLICEQLEQELPQLDLAGAPVDGRQVVMVVVRVVSVLRLVVVVAGHAVMVLMVVVTEVVVLLVLVRGLAAGACCAGRHDGRGHVRRGRRHE